MSAPVGVGSSFLANVGNAAHRRPMWRQALPGVRVGLVKPRPLESRADGDADEENLFWRERAADAARTLKPALLLGSAAFLAFMLLDWTMGHLSRVELVGRVGACIALAGLAVTAHRALPSPSMAEVTRIAWLSAGAILADLFVTILVDGDPAAYPEAWPALLPIYFVTYGQLILPARETVAFGWLTSILLPATGYELGVEPNVLLSSALMLIIVNLFGGFTRCRLETYSRKLFKARRQAEAAAEEKAEFMRQAAHNLRQPLQALSCHSLVLDSSLARNRCPAEIRRTAGKMGSAIDALNESFDRILDLANLELGRQVPHLAEVDVNGLLGGLENQFAPQAVRKGLRLRVVARSRGPYCVRTDASILRQVLCNLIDNAIKYTPHGWVLVTAVRGRTGDVRFCVRDTGIGIPEGQFEGVFKEFHRAHRRESDPQIEGLGIGLAYVRKAVERVPGLSLEFRSHPHHGTEFEVRVAASAEPAVGRAQPDVDDGALSGCNILLVEDDVEVLGALAQELQCWGCRVDQARSLDEVRHLLADSIQPPDLVITDFYLGRSETAHDVIGAVEAECGAETVPTLILSACTITAEDRGRWGDSVSLLRKPAGPKVLLRGMLKALGRQTDTLCP